MRDESPLRRENPSGAVVWVARYTNRAGKRRSAGTFKLRREAVGAIAAAYGQPDTATTVGEYAATWIELRPRSAATNRTARTNLRAALDIEVDGRPLRAWPFGELKPRHADALIAALLAEGRAANGVRGVLRTLSAMTEDAITDAAAELNFTRGRRVRSTDPRIKRPGREARLFSVEQMRTFAAAGRPEVRSRTTRPGSDRCYAAIDYEPVLLTFALTGLRIGEVLALGREDLDGEVLHVRGTLFDGQVIPGDADSKRHVREVPLPRDLAKRLAELAPVNGSPMLFPTPRGKVWTDRNFRRDVWEVAQRASGLDIRPHECRHSYVSHLRAAGVDPADLAQITGHTVDTATRIYTKPLGRSMKAVRAALG